MESASRTSVAAADNDVIVIWSRQHVAFCSVAVWSELIRFDKRNQHRGNGMHSNKYTNCTTQLRSPFIDCAITASPALTGSQGCWSGACPRYLNGNPRPKLDSKA